MPDDANTQNQTPAPESGDVLNVGFSTANDMRLKNISSDVREMRDAVSDIDKTLIKLLGGNASSNMQNFTSNFSMANAPHSNAQHQAQAAAVHAQAASHSSHPSGGSISSFASKLMNIRSIRDLRGLFNRSDENALFKALDGIEEAFCDYIGLPYIGDDIAGKMRGAYDKVASKIADSIGASVDDLPKMLVKAVAKRSLGNAPDDSMLNAIVKPYTEQITSYFSAERDKLHDAMSAAWNAGIQNLSSEGLQMDLDFDSVFGHLFGVDVPSAVEVDAGGGAGISGGAGHRGASFGHGALGNATIEVQRAEINIADASSGAAGAGADHVVSGDSFDQAHGGIADDVGGNGPSSADVASGAGASGASGHHVSSEDLATLADTFGDTISAAGHQLKDMMQDLVHNGAPKLKAAMSGVASQASHVAQKALPAMKNAASGVASQAVKFLPKLAGGLILVDTAFKLIQAGVQFMKDMGEALSELSDSLSNTWQKQMEANVEEQKKRYAADIDTYVRYPFTILKESAEEVRSAWSDVIEVVNQTQGYTKSGLQDLMSAYSARLQQEGLSNVIGSTDITQKLQGILNAGLSGEVAEEFAYISTVLQNAVPTENWDSYAQAYASMVSTFTAAGYSMSDALGRADSQLLEFASNILHAKDVASGLSSSLTGVSGLFEQIVQIAQTAGGGDISALSSALSLVQAVAGQVSSSVGSDLIGQIVQAAIGGNGNDLVALRSMAGVGASNTAFLKALYENPNEVLANLFQNLSSMIDKSRENYMEVAYSLADTFGVSADALVRVDWNRLVSALRSNTSTSSDIKESMDLLASGESTTSAESQKLSQINEYLMDEGLSYIIDNDAAWEVQQHLWDQELAEQITKSTFAVELTGATFDIMKAIQNLVYNILKAIPIVGQAISIGEAADVVMEKFAMDEGIKGMLKAGNVGEGDEDQYHDLTTYEVDRLHRKYDDKTTYGYFSGAYDKSSGTWNGMGAAGGKYSWNGTGKSALDGMSASYAAYGSYAAGGSAAASDGAAAGGASASAGGSASTRIDSRTRSALGKWLGTMDQSVRDGMSYEEWRATAKNYGFSDVSSTLSAYGYDETDLQNQYVSSAVNVGVEQQQARLAREDEFWATSLTWINDTYPADRDAWIVKYDETWAAWNGKFDESVSNWTTLYTDTMAAFQQHLDDKYLEWLETYIEQEDLTHEKQQYLNTQFDERFVNDFLHEWKDYYIGDHTHYVQGTGYSKKWLNTINKEKTDTGEAVLALAKTLMANAKDIKDPQVQTNLFLAKIVELLQSIFNAQKAGNGLTLPTALSALGLNLTGTSSSGKKKK